MKATGITKRRLRVLLFTLLGLAILVLLWFLVRRYLGDALLYLAWILTSLYQTIPQSLIWGLFVLAAFAVALYSLRNQVFEAASRYREPAFYVEYRVRVLATWFENRDRSYYRNRLNFTLTKLAIGIFALTGRVTEQEVKEDLRAGELGLTDNVDQYLRSGLKRWSEEAEGQGPLSFLFRRNGASNDEKFLEVLALLEKELEIGEKDGYS